MLPLALLLTFNGPVEVQRPSRPPTEVSTPDEPTAPSIEEPPAAAPEPEPEPEPLPPVAPIATPIEPAADEISTPPPETDPAVTKKAKPKSKLEHKGFVLDAGVGMLACTKSICRDDDRLNAGPGVKVNAFVGGNIKGIFEIGAQFGWGMLSPKVVPGTNMLSIYGVDPASLADAAEMLGLSVADLEVDDAKTNLLRVGPTFRVHYPPRGRVNGFLGFGFGYSRFRSVYDAAIGKMGITFHGIDVPVQGGVIVWLAKRIALSGAFQYQFTYHLTLSADQPGESVTAPVSLFENGLDASQLRSDLPHFWGFDFGLRIRNLKDPPR